MYYVYRGINRTKKEVYHGVSNDPIGRRDGSHCVGGTRALSHWNCDRHQIIWRVVSKHIKQQNASSAAHNLEANYRHHEGFRNTRTRGI